MSGEYRGSTFKNKLTRSFFMGYRPLKLPTPANVSEVGDRRLLFHFLFNAYSSNLSLMPSGSVVDDILGEAHSQK
jgi:hypothetical protein